MRRSSLAQLVLIVACVGACGHSEEPYWYKAVQSRKTPQGSGQANQAGGQASLDQAMAVRPPVSRDIFPCSQCHDEPDDVDPRCRKLEDEHQKITLEHGRRTGWCYDCHSSKNRDQLRLVNGATVSLEQSHRLCGQCHGPKLHDWRAGVHGKRTGRWNGKKRYLLCVYCHNPHAPRFRPLKPERRPMRPNEI